MMKQKFISLLSKNILFPLIFIGGLLFGLSACDTISIDGKHQTIGCLYGFEKHLVKGGDFWITTYQKVTNKHLPYVFYIEGDGRAFNGKYRVSNDPTPRRKTFIQLAAMDTRPKHNSHVSRKL